MQTWELTAREAIRAAISRYTFAGDRGRAAELAATFAEDGVLEVAGREPVVGRAAIERFIGGVADQAPSRGTDVFGVAGRLAHHVSSVHIVEVTPDAARTSAYFVVMTGQGADHWGRYRDELVRVGEEWLFARRVVHVDGRAPWSAF